MDKSLGKKLQQAREKMGLNITEAAKRLGYPSYQTLRKIENGEREVKASELSLFSKTYFCKISNFLTGDSDTSTSPQFLWRNAPEGQKKMEFETRLFQYAEHGVFLEKILGERKRHQLSKLIAGPEDAGTDASISDFSNRISTTLGLGKRPAFSLQKVLEQDFHVKVIYYDLGKDGSAACTLDNNLGAVIVINSTEVPWRRNFDLAHELFHLLTWGFASPQRLSSEEDFEAIERKADLFASNLLLPSAEVEKEIHDRVKEGKLSYGDLVDISRDFGVSTKALIYRMRNLRMINWEQAKSLASNPNLSFKIRQLKDQEIEPPKSDYMISLAIRCLRKGLISRGKFAEIIEIERPEIDEFIEGYGQIDQEGDLVEIMAT